MVNENMRIKIEAKNPDVARKLERIVRSVEGVQVHRSGAGEGAALLIFELGEDTERDSQRVESLLYTKTVEEVFLTSPTHEAALRYVSLQDLKKHALDLA